MWEVSKYGNNSFIDWTASLEESLELPQGNAGGGLCNAGGGELCDAVGSALTTAGFLTCIASVI